VSTVTTDATPQAEAREVYLIGTTLRFSVSLFLAVAAGLALQIWITALLGAQGPHALYIRSIYTPLGFVALAVSEGVAVVIQVGSGVARRTAREHDIQTVLTTWTALGLGFFALLTSSLVFFGSQVTALLGVAPVQSASVQRFLVLMSVANGLGVIPIGCAAVLRGLGKTAASSILLTGEAVAAGVLMLGIEALHPGVDGVPLGYLAVVAASAFAGLGLVRRATGTALRTSRLSFHGVGHQLWATAVPVSGSFLLLALVTSGYLRMLARSPAAEITGFTLGQILQTYLIVPGIAIGSAAAIAVTLAQGSDRAAIARAGRRALIAIAAPSYVLIGLAVTLARHRLVGLFTADAHISAVATGYLVWVGPTLALLGITLAALTFLEQVGHARSAFILNVTFFAAIFLAALAFGHPVRPALLAHIVAAANVLGFFGVFTTTSRLLRRPREARVAP
jgi:Na+-driven multidrug efflux pump